MSWMRERAVMVVTVSLLAFAISQVEPSSLLMASVVVVAIGAALCARFALRSYGSRELTIGLRARQHRELLHTLPEPQHPDTAGRVRSRAPALVVSATALSVV